VQKGCLGKTGKLGSTVAGGGESVTYSWQREKEVRDKGKKVVGRGEKGAIFFSKCGVTKGGRSLRKNLENGYKVNEKGGVR